MMVSKVPVLRDNKHVVIITQLNPYAPVGGVTLILNNLLSVFDKNSYTICYLGYFKPLSFERDTHSDTFRLIPNHHIINLLGLLWSDLKLEYATRRAIKVVKRKNAQLIFGLYPTYKSLYVATETARRCNVKFIPWLHDTVSEGLSHTILAEKAIKLQENVFKQADKILTMSQGMSDYYIRKYNIETFPLEHPYPELPKKSIVTNRKKTAFWGGAVHHLNDKSLERVVKALRQISVKIEVTSLQINATKIDGPIVMKKYYPRREDYLHALDNQGVLILAANWPDETNTHEAELSTIFPTRAIEYLASGGCILVHCPEDYFLAKFFRENNCGIVVSERSINRLSEALEYLLSGVKEVTRIQENALKVSERFSIQRVSKLFQNYLQ